MKSSSRSWLGPPSLLIAAAIWSVLVFIHYFSFPEAIDLSFLKVLPGDLGSFESDKFFGNWIWFLKNLLGTVLLWVAFSRMGVRISGWLGLGQGPAHFWIETVLGMVFLGFVWIGLGFNGLWQEGFLKLFLVGLSLWALIDLRRAKEGGPPFPWTVRSEKATKGLAFLGFIFVGVAFGMAAAPDVFYDGLVYHLSTLQGWLDRHAIADLPTNLYSYYPFGGEQVFLNGYLLGGSEGAKFLNALSFLLTGAVVASWAAEEAGVGAGAAAWAMVLVVPLFSASVWTSQVDVLLALFVLLFLLSLWRYAKGWGKGWIVTAGLFAGAALSTKYTVGPGLLLAVGLVSVLGPRERERGKWFGGMGLVALGIFAPWVIRNVVLCGNPIYPYPFLGWGRSLPAANLTNLFADHELVWSGHFSFLEWADRFLNRDLNKTTAPLLLGSLPLLFLWRKMTPITKVLWVLGGLWLLLGFSLSYQPRLSIPAFVLLFVAGGMSLGSVPHLAWKRGAATLIWIFGLLSLLSLGRLAVHYYRVDRVWLGVENQREYLTQSPQTASYFSLAQAAARLVPEDKRLLIVGDARSLYYPCPVVANSVFDPQVPDLLADKDPDGIRRGLLEMGVDVLVVPGAEGARLFGDRFPYTADGPESGNWKAFRTRWLQPLYADGKSAIFLLRDDPGPTVKK